MVKYVFFTANENLIKELRFKGKNVDRALIEVSVDTTKASIELKYWGLFSNMMRDGWGVDSWVWKYTK